MNMQWAYPVEPVFPHELMRADADGITHLDESLLAEIFGGMGDDGLADDFDLGTDAGIPD